MSQMAHLKEEDTMRSKFLLLTGVLMLAFTGCGTEGDSSSDANSGNVVDDSAES